MKNCLHIYYGDGKGKTTSAIGQAIRSCGRGMNVVVTTFLKNDDSGEFLLSYPFTHLKSHYPDKFWNYLTDDEKNNAREDAVDRIQTIINDSNKYDMIVFDEFLDAVSLGLISEEFALSTIRKLVTECEVILTGHFYIESIFTLGDYITEMKKVKHPYDNGCLCRNGIEK